MKRSALTLLLALSSAYIFAQGTFSGDLMMNLNFFQRDTAIRAANNPLYDNYLSGSEGWLDLRYNYKGFTVFARVDAFNNSNLKNPTEANTSFGIGAWSVSKQTKDLTITAGYIYDQVGSGILFRAYEDRGLLIDNALVGFQLKYKLNSHITLKGMTGQQKDNDFGSTSAADNSLLTLSQRYAPVIKVFNAEGDYNIGKAHLIPGIGFLNRTLDQASMNSIVNTLDGYVKSAQFEPMYNMYAFTAYNTLTIGNFSWYAEGAYKTHEAVVNLANVLVDKPGNVEYTTLGYAQKGIALNVTGKRTDFFVMRTSPNQTLTDGLLNWQPIVADLRPQRLMSRYSPASQDISEMAGTADLLIAPSDYLNSQFTYTHIDDLNGQDLYREIYGEASYRGVKSWIFSGGAQYLEYNQAVYDSKTLPMLYAITPFGEVTYRFTNTKSLRFEMEYMNTKQDYGSWVFALLEYNLAPRWSFSASDMYNIKPNPASNDPNVNETTLVVPSQGNNYYDLYISYTKAANRFSVAYVKQVDGINCSGGVCRYEPAFSGVRATITSSF